MGTESPLLRAVFWIVDRAALIILAAYLAAILNGVYYTVFPMTLY